MLYKHNFPKIILAFLSGALLWLSSWADAATPAAPISAIKSSWALSGEIGGGVDWTFHPIDYYVPRDYPTQPIIATQIGPSVQVWKSCKKELSETCIDLWVFGRVGFGTWTTSQTSFVQTSVGLEQNLFFRKQTTFAFTTKVSFGIGALILPDPTLWLQGNVFAFDPNHRFILTFQIGPGLLFNLDRFSSHKGWSLYVDVLFQLRYTVPIQYSYFGDTSVALYIPIGTRYQF